MQRSKFQSSSFECWISKMLVNPEGNQPWIVTGRTDAEAEASVLWPSDAKTRLLGKDPDAGKDWRKKKRASVDEMVGWHHQFNGHELGQTPGDGEGQGGLACCSPWGCKELDMTWWLNSNNKLPFLCYCWINANILLRGFISMFMRSINL